MQALLALEDGRLFYGTSFGDRAGVGAEVVFCTAMTGYQEVMTDPSYHGQIVVFTAPHIGNYGIHDGHDESLRAWAAGIIVRDLSEAPGHPDAVESLRHYVRRQRLVGMTDVDTRALTLHLRDRGVMRGFFTIGLADRDEAVAMARSVPPMAERNLVRDVTARRIETRDGMPAGPRVAVLDFGAKTSIVRELARRGCRVTVVPATTPASEVKKLKPDGIFLSNGPGDPQPCDYAIAATRDLVECGYPTFGICLGHQIMALASGAKTFKMKFGHHGANHPVKDLDNGRVSITSQNHGFAVDEKTLPANLRATHVSLFDGTLQGLARTDRPAFCFQGHPEASPGPHDIAYLFDRFVALMESK